MFNEYKNPKAGGPTHGELLATAAEAYMKAGWYVFPVGGDDGKQPTTGQTPHGHKDATLDPTKFNWSDPAAKGIAIDTGRSRVVVVDTDTASADKEFHRLTSGNPHCNTIAKSPRGYHYLYADPDGVFRCKNNWHTNIDIKATGGYVILPGGLKCGDRSWLKASPKNLSPPPASIAHVLPRDSDDPQVAPDPQSSNLPILERHGWTYVGAGTGNLYYRRPGKADGKSATWNGLVLFVHTPNAPPFEEGKGYTKGEVHRLLEGPRSTWRRENLKNLFDANNLKEFFDMLAGASALIQDEWRTKWDSGKRVFDRALREARSDAKRDATGASASGNLLQREYPILFMGIEREIKLNECNQDIEVSGEYLDDAIWHHMMDDALVWAQARGRSVREIHMLHALYAEAQRHAYNPLKIYFEGLGGSEGGEDALDALIGMFGSDATGAGSWIRSWIVGCVARTYDPDYQNPMLVLQGAQNLGKSYFAKWLCSEIPQYFYAGAISPNDKDCQLMQSRALIWEVEELEGTTRKAAVAGLKAFVSKATTRLRAPYGKRDMKRAVIANYIGTVNEENFLSDDTGNRRFLVVPLLSIDWSYSDTLTPGSVWAAALKLYREGVDAWQLSLEEMIVAERSASMALDTSDVDAYMASVATFVDDAERVWLNDIVLALQDEGVRVSSNQRLKRAICNYMKKKGRERLRGRRGRGPESYFDGVVLHTWRKSKLFDGIA